MSGHETFTTLRYAVGDDGVAIITLDRPDARNAYNTAMMNELVAAFDRIDADDAVRAVILTGAGEVFCAGADLSGGGAGFARLNEEPERARFRYGEIWRDGGGVAALRIFAASKPVIAAVDGAAVGVGATMLLPCDVRLASTRAKFGFPFVARGLVPEAASSWFLPRIVGISRALEWTLAARMVPAVEAEVAGLVRAVHPPDELLQAARALARELGGTGAPVAVALTRAMMWRMPGAAHPMEAHRVDSRAIAACRAGPDLAEGVAAFLEKRPPQFAGRVSDGLPDIWAGSPTPPFF